MSNSPADARETQGATPMARLAEIEARANAATCGPWYAMDGGLEGFDGSWDVIGPDFCGIADVTGTAKVAKHPRDKEANAEFMAHAREDVPWLIEQLRAALAAKEPRES